MANKVYRIVLENSDADICIGHTYLKTTDVSEEEEKRLIEEAEQWELIRDIKGYEKLYWHNNDIIDHSSVENIMFYYGAGMIVKDGHFYGTLINAKDTSSMGMQVNCWKDTGLICIDGNKDGKADEWETHGSDEVWWEHKVTYILRKK